MGAFQGLGDVLRSRFSIVPPTPDSETPLPAPCAICGGIEWLRRDVPLEDPAFGKAFPCSCVAAIWEERRQVAIRAWCALPAAMGNCTFDSLVRRRDVPGWDEAVQFCGRYARGESEQPILFLMGPNGTGKSHLGLAILNWRLAAGGPYGRYANTADWLDELRATFNRSETDLLGMTFDQLWQSYVGADLVMLDDLGMQQPTPWAQEKLEQFLDHRYREGLPTILTTNTRRSNLGPRLESRLRHERLVKAILLDGPDYRLKGQP